MFLRAAVLLSLISAVAVAEESPSPIAPAVEVNDVSVHGAPTLGQWKRGQSVMLGFPLIGVKASIGLFDRLDFGLGFQSYYGLMNEFLAFIKVGIFRGTRWSFSAVVEGSGAFFVEPMEVRGSRWVTGHRNYGLSPGILLTYQATSLGARWFAQVDYLATFETAPVGSTGHNVRAHLGAELPLSPKISFVFLVGIGVHGRVEDSPLMPTASLGIVTGF